MKIALIGYGKWGKIIFSNLKKISKNVFLIKKRSKINFSKKLVERSEAILNFSWSALGEIGSRVRRTVSY